MLILPLNTLTLELSVAALIVATIYPFTKRFLPLPQAVLRVAFCFGYPYGVRGRGERSSPIASLMLFANVFWSIAYDTDYAKVDREYDLTFWLRSAAISFGRHDVRLCYCMMLLIYAGMARTYT